MAHLIFGPQNEPFVVASEEEARSLCTRGTFSLTKRKNVPAVAVAAGTDRSEFATTGPQGEILPTTDDEDDDEKVCPACGRPYPESED